MHLGVQLQGSTSQGTIMSLFLNKYTIFLDKAQYLQSSWHKVYRYKSPPTTVSTRCEVSPDECYISPIIYDVNFIQKYSWVGLAS